MSHPVEFVYQYDGSFEGFLSCIYESCTEKETPMDIVSEEMGQIQVLPVKCIEKNSEKAARVYTSLRKKISLEARDWIECGFLSCEEDREMLLYRFIRKGYKVGAKILNYLGDTDVHELEKRVCHVRHEAHLFTGFLRFSDYEGLLVAVIEPKNRILPRIVSHFTDRFCEEAFIIYDKTHASALVYRSYEWVFTEVRDFKLPDKSETEQAYETMWRTFYDTIGILARHNPKCQRAHLPKRYRRQMTEFNKEEVSNSYCLEGNKE